MCNSIGIEVSNYIIKYLSYHGEEAFRGTEQTCDIETDNERATESKVHKV